MFVFRTKKKDAELESKLWKLAFEQGKRHQQASEEYYQWLKQMEQAYKLQGFDSGQLKSQELYPERTIPPIIKSIFGEYL